LCIKPRLFEQLSICSLLVRMKISILPRIRILFDRQKCHSITLVNIRILETISIFQTRGPGANYSFTVILIIYYSSSKEGGVYQANNQPLLYFLRSAKQALSIWIGFCAFSNIFLSVFKTVVHISQQHKLNQPVTHSLLLPDHSIIICVGNSNININTRSTISWKCWPTVVIIQVQVSHILKKTYK